MGRIVPSGSCIGKIKGQGITSLAGDESVSR